MSLVATAVRLSCAVPQQSLSREGFVSHSYAIRWNAACLTIVINVMIQRRISLVRGWCHESDCDGSRRLSHVPATIASVSGMVRIFRWFHTFGMSGAGRAVGRSVTVGQFSCLLCLPGVCNLPVCASCVFFSSSYLPYTCPLANPLRFVYSSGARDPRAVKEPTALTLNHSRCASLVTRRTALIDTRLSAVSFPLVQRVPVVS